MAPNLHWPDTVSRVCLACMQPHVPTGNNLPQESSTIRSRRRSC